ncbi:MAG: hypothetical protein WD227_08755 [Vicinamibacterales bacterium]
MRSTISIARAGDAAFVVTVDDGTTRTVHDVTVTPQDVARYAPGMAAGRLVRASFQFLLEREPKEAILQRFELPTIERYFPEYPSKIRELL